MAATNREAKVERVYNPGGTLAADTLRVRAWTGTDFSHVYGLQYRYDLNGRRTRLVHPRFTAPVVGGVVRDSTKYSYGADDGRLASVIDPLGDAFNHHYDAAGRLDSLLAPGNVYLRWVFDDDDQIVRRVLHGIECDLDHQLSYVNTMLQALSDWNPHWDFEIRAQHELRDLAEFRSRVEALELPLHEAEPLLRYVAATERLLSAVLREATTRKSLGG